MKGHAARVVGGTEYLSDTIVVLAARRVQAFSEFVSIPRSV